MVSTDNLRSLQAIRSECNLVYDAVSKGQSQYYSLDESKLQNIASAIDQMIQTEYSGNVAAIKPHGRWRHIPQQFLAGLSPEQYIDLFTISVLLDAGAGSEWQYRYEGHATNRSEGIAVAVAVAFKKGLFSGDRQSQVVDSAGLMSLTIDSLNQIFQIDKQNPMIGSDGRVALLNKLGGALGASPIFSSTGRPSAMIQFIKEHHHPETLNLEWFWSQVIIDGFKSVWPSDRPDGDVHFCALTGRKVPFHKLSQWLCYSLLEPIQKLFGYSVINQHLLTGLAEYRNGGLLIDYQVIIPKFENIEFKPADQEVVEWRALTVVLLDKLHRSRFATLSLPQLLEAGTWSAGRQIARQKRATGAPPIIVQSDGTLF